MVNKTIFQWRRGVAAVIILLVLLGLTTTLALGSGSDSNVFPPDSSPYGLTYGQWSALWWDWAFAIPKEKNPLYDPTGENCDVGQIGPVWFLGGTFEIITGNQGELIGNATRDCKIPADKAIFFPVINAECSTIEGNGTTDQKLRACAKGFIDTVTSLSASIDGASIENLTPPDSPYRVQSPLFVFALPPGNILGIDTNGTIKFSKSVSDGYWVMLKPLSPGKHKLHFTGDAQLDATTTFKLDITYNLKVAKK